MHLKVNIYTCSYRFYITSHMTCMQHSSYNSIQYLDTHHLYTKAMQFGIFMNSNYKASYYQAVLTPQACDP